MRFTSLVFLALLLPTLGLFWSTQRQRLRLVVLLVASLTFYAWLHWPSVLLLVGTIVANYTLARWQERRRSKGLLAFAVIFNLSFLLWFKYARFLATALASALGHDVPALPWTGFLPLGISFFTFQVVAYQVDVYRGEVAAEHDLLVFAVFKSFFAQLIAGPIVRAKDVLPQLRALQPWRPAWAMRGLFLCVAGLALKLGVADVLAQFAINTFDQPASALASTATSDAWLGVWAYTFELFADFWGYSTMAVGLGLLFGLTLPVNFRLPYLSPTLREFWRRWHITLSEWIRDYLYIPLGGNRRWPAATLVATMAVAGLWHGAGWNFVLWGAAHGVWLAVERGLGLHRAPTSRAGRATRTALVFLGVSLLWVLFRAKTLATAVLLWKRLLLPPYTFNPAVPEVLSVWLVGFALAMVPLARQVLDEAWADRPLRQQVLVTALLLLLTLAYAGATFDFIYYAF